MKKYLYDQVPYDTRAYTNAHPRNLAAIGTLYGLAPTAIDQCRVLVLGCAQGGNLFPAAVSYPDSQFVGIDNSERQIETARATAEQLGLTNTTLHCMDIMNIDDAMGQFDYIIAHGIYSWIPSHVRDKVFQICKTHLTPHGIAYLSYNTLPGWHINGIVRDIMLYRFNEYEDPEEGLDHALDYLAKIADSTPAQNNPYMTLLKQIQAQVNGNKRSYLLHEYLAEINDAFYFHEIVEKGAGLGLQYLGDATFIGKEFTSHSPELNNRFKAISHDMTDFEQHFDFMNNRVFRSSLFCHQELPMQATIPAEPAGSLYFSSMAQVAELPAGQYPADMVGFRNNWGGVMVDPHPLFQGAMKHLIDIYPQAVTFTELVEIQLQGPLPNQAQEIAQLYARLLKARAGSLINITTDKPAVLLSGRWRTPGFRPIAAPFARLQAQSGDVVVSAWNENVGLNAFSRQVLALLDGTRRVQELKKELLSLCENGTLSIPFDGNATGLNEVIEQRLENSLAFFSKSGLLVTQKA